MKTKEYTFFGGIHPRSYKELSNKYPIEEYLPKSQVIIPLQQHIGAPCIPLIKVNDYVKVGQKIGEANGFVSAPVHSSVSGKVVAIEDRPSPSGKLVKSIVIESDGEFNYDDNITPNEDINNMKPEEIRQIVREAGIVGMGGATFPTMVKLNPPSDKKIDIVILNGAECEPYLTADHRLMLEKPVDIVHGLLAIMKALGASKGYVGVEDNKKDAIKEMKKSCKEFGDIEVAVLKTKYPQGSEKHIIKAITGREIPSGKLPADIGVVVDNVGTAFAIAEAIKFGKPLIERVVTVTGEGIMTPKNLRVKIGTPFRELIEYCGGFKGTPGKVISGGPMMGIAQYSIDVPVIKGTSGILVLPEDRIALKDPKPCIKCARCVDACPMNLLPLFISAYSLKNDFNKCKEYHALDCIECGSCSYVCPSKRPLVESIRLAKREILRKRRK
ncbi:electron transporter [Thermoanaerobacterium thermosaccharolyticum]|uniref:Ion-translocating oxidoreductase complex subunit C n=1 Tax=Thermoanaerobacterium thermosaccharolyticum TaxID=1517 RepID=A0A223I1C3_THETR|nr:electron transport complex subunit RsxC [Thermoanaerobacterium thermosaccharolyticum]AST58457.1 electron transporter [Thermoanaerobacterium thermosaccharolyticum]